MLGGLHQVRQIEATGVVGSWLQLIPFSFRRSYLISNYAYPVYVGMVTVCPARKICVIEGPQRPTLAVSFGPMSPEPRRRSSQNPYYQILLCGWL